MGGEHIHGVIPISLGQILPHAQQVDVVRQSVYVHQTAYLRHHLPVAEEVQVPVRVRLRHRGKGFYQQVKAFFFTKTSGGDNAVGRCIEDIRTGNIQINPIVNKGDPPVRQMKAVNIVIPTLPGQCDSHVAQAGSDPTHENNILLPPLVHQSAVVTEDQLRPAGKAHSAGNESGVIALNDGRIDPVGAKIIRQHGTKLFSHKTQAIRLFRQGDKGQARIEGIGGAAIGQTKADEMYLRKICQGGGEGSGDLFHAAHNRHIKVDQGDTLHQPFSFRRRPLARDSARYMGTLQRSTRAAIRRER